MDITLLTVGKTDVKWVKEGLDLYVSRLKQSGRVLGGESRQFCYA